MPLTPEDVREKRFTAVRLREGYDMGEVDQFLDEVEAELERLLAENAELRRKLEILEGSAAQPAEQTRLQVSQPAEPAKVAEPEPEPAKVAEPEPAVEAPKATTVSEASVAAARLLEIASNNADQLMESAKEEADRILSEARAEAERLETESKEKAERLEAVARMRAHKLDEETNQRRQQALADIERQRQELQAEVDHLRAYEREYRARLKAYFENQLKQLSEQENVEPTSQVRRGGNRILAADDIASTPVEDNDN